MSKETWTFNELKFPKPDLRAFVDMNEDAIRRVEEAQDGEGVLEVIFEHNQLLRRINDLLEVMFVKRISQRSFSAKKIFRLRKRRQSLRPSIKN